MASRSTAFNPRPMSAETPQDEINSDQDDLMAGSDFEAEQQRIHRSSASTSLTNATRRRPTDALAESSPSSSASLPTPATGQGATSANALHDSPSSRRNGHRAEALSEDSATRAVSGAPSNPTSRSPSSLFTAGSGDEDEDEDEDEYLPGDSEDEGATADGIRHGAENIQRSVQRPNCRSFFTNDEDATLRDAVKQHGTRWVQVAKSFNQPGRGMTRSKGSLEKRWKILLKSSKGQPDPRARGRQTRPWTEEETNVLLESLRLRRREDGHRPHSEHLVDFRNAFPNSTRSDRVIYDKCYHLYQKQISGRRSSTFGSHTNTASLNAAEAPASSSTLLNGPTAATRGSPFASNQEHDRISVHASSTSENELPVDLDNPAHSLTLGGERCPISPPGTASTQGNASSSMLQAQAQPQRQPQQQTNQQRQPQASQTAAQPLDANMLIEQKSVCIENCPRDCHVAVYTETLVKITRETPLPTVIAFGTSYEAAYHFYIRANGAIRALRLPEDTTTDVTPVPPSESCDGGTYIDTVFTGPDDFVVLFRSSL